MNFLAETRVEKAKILLKTTDYRVSKIAHLVGYADEKIFRRVFRKISGLSPAEYQNLWQKGWPPDKSCPAASFSSKN